MRNFKRFLSLVLAVLCVIGSSVITVGAEEGADYTEAANNLAAIGILKGDGNGDLMLDKSVTRYQAALFFVQAITGKTDASIWNADKSAIFSDVPEYGTAIDYLAGLGLIVGRGNGIYGYNDPVTYQDMLTIAVRALGYETKDMVYPYGHIAAAQKLGLTDNIGTVNFKEALPRGATAQLIWDLLSTEIAITDPISGEIIYPGKEDESAYGILLGPGKIIRETYL
ncbi:MAG: S-layer homology domain-containing protein, partial [Clostridia bacterium]|nr:S-layer homology domain-containing protein [Clostridia bacterium]